MRRFTTRPEILGTFGMVTSTHWLASAAGMGTLEKGGNAFDAAVATGFALQVVEPHLNGPGGEVPILLHDSRIGGVEVICGQGVAPGAATLDRFRDLDLDLVPGTGLLPAVVPGAVDAWLLMLRDHGTIELAEALSYAIGYAERGYPIVPGAAETIADRADMFRADWPSSAELWLSPGPPDPGALVTNRPLAETWKRLVREAEAAGRDREGRIEAARMVWREGFVAEAIDRFVREAEVRDGTGRAHRGFLTGEDMARWQATKETPVSLDYHGYTLCKTGPWGQGPVALQQLALLKGFDLGGLNETDPEFVHLVTECAKLAFADRESFYGDPDFVPVPVETLLSDAYNDARRRLVGDRASFELRPGTVDGFGAAPIVRLAGEETAPGGGEPTVARFHDGPTEGDTCHLDIIDSAGNMVSATPSGGWLQSSPAVPGLGFALSSRGQMFWLDADHPAGLAPFKRPRTTLTPSLALRDGAPYLAFGTPGGDQQDQWALHVFLRHVHFGLNLQEAIDAPEFHTTHFPSSFHPRTCRPGRLIAEARFPEPTMEALRARGHDLEVDLEWSLGRVTAAAKTGPLLKAAANPRFMQGYAAGR